MRQASTKQLQARAAAINTTVYVCVSVCLPVTQVAFDHWRGEAQERGGDDSSGVEGGLGSGCVVCRCVVPPLAKQQGCDRLPDRPSRVCAGLTVPVPVLPSTTTANLPHTNTPLQPSSRLRVLTCFFSTMKGRLAHLCSLICR